MSMVVWYCSSYAALLFSRIGREVYIWSLESEVGGDVC